MDVEADRIRYEIDRAKDIALSGAHGIDEVMQAERLDAILFPAESGAILSARPGYPTVIVPFAMVANTQTPPIPQAFDAGRGPARSVVTRSRFANSFVRAMASDFEQYGLSAIKRVRSRYPAIYLKICAMMLPKEIRSSHCDMRHKAQPAL